MLAPHRVSSSRSTLIRWLLVVTHSRRGRPGPTSPAPAAPGIWPPSAAPTPGTRIGDWRYARLTEGERRALPHAYDCLLKREVNCNECATYVTAKRQLGHRELRQHGLRA